MPSDTGFVSLAVTLAFLLIVAAESIGLYNSTQKFVREVELTGGKFVVVSLAGRVYSPSTALMTTRGSSVPKTQYFGVVTVGGFLAPGYCGPGNCTVALGSNAGAGLVFVGLASWAVSKLNAVLMSSLSM